MAGSSAIETFGICGFAARTTPPKLSSIEKLPTVAKSFWTASSVSCLLVEPTNWSSWAYTTIFRPLMPPCELT